MGSLCLVLSLSGTFAALAVASSLSRLLAYVVCIGALPRVRARADEETRAQAYVLPGGHLVPAIALLICFILILQTTLANWVALAALLAVGVALYLAERFVVQKRFTQP